MQTVWMETEADRLRRERDDIAAPVRAHVAQTLRRCEERRVRAQEKTQKREEIRAGIRFVIEDIVQLPRGVQLMIGGMTGALSACVMLTIWEWVVFWFEKFALR